MAQQQQQQRDVSQYQLCPPNKHFDLMDANKKFDLVNPQCPNESKILVDILNNHPLRTCVAASASVPWIYMAQFWYTLKMDQSKFKFKFVLNTKELPMTVADFICIFQLPQATDNNHAGFVDAPTFSQMVPFCHNALGFSLTLRPSSNFVSKGLPHSWQTLCKIFTRCLTTRVTGHDQPPTVSKVKEHMVDKELDQLLEGAENVDVDAFMDDVLNSQEYPGTRIETMSYKESPKVKKSVDDVIITNDDVEEESSRDEFELRRREKRKGIVETKDTSPSTSIRSPSTHIASLSTDKETL
ncbi:hypothetical protein Tco_0536802 [Tanacetum coccineum]